MHEIPSCVIFWLIKSAQHNLLITNQANLRNHCRDKIANKTKGAFSAGRIFLQGEAYMVRSAVSILATPVMSYLSKLYIYINTQTAKWKMYPKQFCRTLLISAVAGMIARVFLEVYVTKLIEEL